MVPTRKRRGKASGSSVEQDTGYQTLYEEALNEIKRKDEEIIHLKQEITALLREHEEYLKNASMDLRNQSAKIGTVARKYSV